MRTAINISIVLLVALAFAAAPGGDATLGVLLTLLTIGFFAAIAFLGYRLYREHSFTLESLEERERLVLYSSIGLAFLAFVATSRLFDAGGLGVLAFLALLGLASYGVYWVFTHSRRYD
jgi:Kef-type K+ transport system membrane component KefB